MRPLWVNLNEQERAAFRAVTSFLDGRLEERSTIDWALRLKPGDKVSRLALLDLVNAMRGHTIREPWRSAWRLIEEAWESPHVEDHASTGDYLVQGRLHSGERTGSLISAVVDLVRPRLSVKAFSESHKRYEQPIKRPKGVEDLFSIRVASGRLIDPGVLNLERVTEPSFLVSLAVALEAAVVAGLEIARQLGWEGKRGLWRMGQLHRVYYVPESERSDGDNEPDEFQHGIAPSVKFLHAVVSRLAEVNISIATEFTRRWKATNSPVHLRLWAALARDSRIAPASEVGTMLLALDDDRFWNLNAYPEVAELRAKRFKDLADHDQIALIARIRKCPPAINGHEKLILHSSGKRDFFGLLKN